MSSSEFEELPRLIDQASSPLERAILGAGRQASSCPSRSDRRRTQVLLALGVGSTIAFGSKTSLALAAGWKKALLSGVVVASGAIGVVAYQQAHVSPAVDVTPAEPSGPAQRAIRVTHEAPEAAPAAPEPTTFEELPKEEAAPSIPRRAPYVRARNNNKVEEPPPPREVAKPRQAASASRIQGEVQALDRARAALRSGSSALALERLRDYSNAYPRGSLRLEAEVLRIEAFAAAGNHTEASHRAKRILDRSPNSVLAARLRRYVED